MAMDGYFCMYRHFLWYGRELRGVWFLLLDLILEESVVWWIYVVVVGFPLAWGDSSN